MHASPHSWDSDPPETKSESWNYERRTELLSVAQGVLQAQVMGAMRREAWEESENGIPTGIDTKLAVRLAKDLIDEAERIRPKL